MSYTELNFLGESHPSAGVQSMHNQSYWQGCKSMITIVNIIVSSLVKYWVSISNIISYVPKIHKTIFCDTLKTNEAHLFSPIRWNNWPVRYFGDIRNH